MARRGRDPAPLDDAGRRLAASFHPIALGMAGRFARRSPWLRDDFESAAGLACAQAAARYDPARGASFSTYAYRTVVSRLMDVVREARKRRPGRLGPHAHQVADPRPPDRGFEADEAFAALLRPARGRERRVLARYFGGQDQAAVARALGISATAVSRDVRAGLDRIRTRLTEEEDACSS